MGKVIMIALFYLLFFGYSALSQASLMTSRLFFALFAYFGRKALDRIQPNVFLIMPIGGWLLYFVIKGLLAIFVGIFVAPFVIANKIAVLIPSEVSEVD